jgi:nitrogenase molybdenum-iron protein alpha/beta subunit
MDAGSFIGAFRACSGISDAAVICHSPTGCKYSASFFGSVSGQSRVMHSCSMLQEREVVFGGEEKLKAAIEKAYSLYRAPLNIVLSGDVPSIIGDDVASAVEGYGRENAVIVEALGFKGSMSDGYGKALAELSSIMEPVEPMDRTVNLIGFSPDDYKVKADIRELKRCLGGMGVRVNCAVSCCTVREFKSAPAAALNVVLGQGLPLAKKMEKEYGIPYIDTGYPYGTGRTFDLLDSVASFFSIAAPPVPDVLDQFGDIYLFIQSLYGKPVSLTGDFHAGTMADFLTGDLGMDIRASGCYEDGEVFESMAMESDSILLLGSSFEKGMARKMGVPLIRYVYPVFDMVSIYDGAPYAGYRGSVCLIQDMLNAMMDYDYI